MCARSTLASFLLICFAAIPHAIWSSSPSTARRCLSGWNDDTLSLFDDLAQSTCEPCDATIAQRTYVDTNTTQNLTHVGIVLPHMSTLAEPYLMISAVLLMRGHNVTMFLNKRHMGGPPYATSTATTTDQDIRDFIQSHVPCDAQLATSNLLHMEHVSMNTYPCYDGDYKAKRIHCAIREASGTFLTERFRSTLRTHPVDMLLLDAGLMAGQLAAHSLGIPVVALLDPEFYDDLLVRRWIHTTPPSTWGRLTRGLSDFWQELQWMSSFAKYNRICRRLGLPVLSTVTEIWSSVRLVLTRHRETKSNRVSVMQGPMLTPCIPCTVPSPIDKFEAFNSRVLLSLADPGNDPKLTRDLFKAFWIARDSLLSQWTLSCKTEQCPPNVTDLYDFGVARSGPSNEKYFPHFLAPFGVDVSFLSALGYLLSNEEKILLIVVDSKMLESFPWIRNFDPPVLEVTSGDLSVREMAKEIMRGIHRVHVPNNRLRTVQGMEPVLDALLADDSWPIYNGTLEDEEDAENAHAFLSWWFGSCSVVALVASIWELYREGESWEHMGEILWKQFGWSEVEATLRKCQTWLWREWNGDGDAKNAVTKSSASSSATSHSHRRRKAHKKKQA